ncbi:class I SAM-dependent methyltransferase [Microlunatus sp. GCM10028923]|uniref:class I SAM-dependent methyltransferase n=1 Tax=Microlunatus sp. GCM10028923 TaxID=3273400 RepID=UPI003614F4C6
MSAAIPTDPSRINLPQARRRAKELLAQVLAGDVSAIARLQRPHTPARLSDAQYAVARELGFADWPALVREREEFAPADLDDMDLTMIKEVTVVCLPRPGAVTLFHDQVDHDRLRCPHDQLLAGEDAWGDAVLRIPLSRMGFRRQGTHLFATDERRHHAVFWVDGGPYTGNRPQPENVTIWTGTVAEAAGRLRSQGDSALARLVEWAEADRAAMTYARHQRDLQRTLTGTYLRSTTLPGGSGFGGSEEDWRDARQGLTFALDGLAESLGRPGQPVSFCDLGCANGHLPASFVEWGAERGVTVEPYGVDLAPELIDRARQVYPQWADRFRVGDALTWRAPEDQRFDLVHVLLDVIPDDLHGSLLENCRALVTPGGRLLVSSYAILVDRGAEALVTAQGYQVDGRTPRRRRRSNGKPYGQPSVWLRVP